MTEQLFFSLYTATSKQNSHRKQLQESKDLFLRWRILAEVEQQAAKLSLKRCDTMNPECRQIFRGMEQQEKPEDALHCQEYHCSFMK